MTGMVMTGDAYPEGYFERAEGSNYTNYGDDPGWYPTVRAMLGCTGPDGQWLEVACAKGWFVRQARSQGIACFGVDISPYAISQAQVDVRPYVAVEDAAHLSAPDGAFDVVCGWEFMEHVPEDQIDEVLSEVERVTKPGATVWFRIGILGTGHPGEDHDATHVSMHDREWWLLRFQERGWQHATLFEEHLDDQFPGRDWQGRFFVYRVP